MIIQVNREELKKHLTILKDKENPIKYLNLGEYTHGIDETQLNKLIKTLFTFGNDGKIFDIELSENNSIIIQKGTFKGKLSTESDHNLTLSNSINLFNTTKFNTVNTTIMTATEVTAQELINLIAESKNLNKAKTLNSILLNKGLDISVRGLRAKGLNETHVWNRLTEMEKFLISEGFNYETLQEAKKEFQYNIENPPAPYVPAPKAPAEPTAPTAPSAKYIADRATPQQVEDAAERVKENIIQMVKNLTPNAASADLEKVKELINMAEERANDKIFDIGFQLIELQKLYENLEKCFEQKIAVKETVYVTPKMPEGVNVGRTHEQFYDLLKLTIAGKTVNKYPWITGGAGGGKTHAAKQVAEALNVPFRAMSVSAQMTETALRGYQNANGNYISTSFRDCYENGGLFCLDEIDNGNSNILSALNSAIANGVCGFPDKSVEMNKDFYLIATANTTGNGATKAYVGRNQIGADTKDRFFFIDWKYDKELERSMSFGNEIAYNKVQELREAANRHNLTCVISPRATAGIAALMAAGYNLNEAVNFNITEKLTPQEKSALNL